MSDASNVAAASRRSSGARARPARKRSPSADGKVGAGASPEERARLGKAARTEVPRRVHADWEPASERPDPIALLEEQAAMRVPELVPIRHGRMMSSPFAFFRGAAYVMAADLAPTPATGIRVQLCGDAHLANFGGFASPERDLLFDLNDFDETLPGPWEWDLKRLAASLEIAGRDRGFERKQRRTTVRTAAREYRQAMRTFAALPRVQVWYSRLDETTLGGQLRAEASARQARGFDKAVTKARAKTSMRAFSKLTHLVDGEPRIVSDPPLLVPIEELLEPAESQRFGEAMASFLGSYGATLQGDRRRLFEGYRYVHLARKVVGVGSVGTRCWIVLLIGRDGGDPLFLQCKEAPPSVLERFAGKGEFAHNGQRVVEGQRMMQAASDIFLGWLHNEGGLDGVPRDFYVRQLWDWKASADLATLAPESFPIYARMCGWTLARAHARSGDAIAIGAYLGNGEDFDKALADFAERYADQNERDHQALVEAVRSGRLEAIRDV
jgi:uncharacterized protein (DUF2252 family)